MISFCISFTLLGNRNCLLLHMLQIVFSVGFKLNLIVGLFTDRRVMAGTSFQRSCLAAEVVVGVMCVVVSDTCFSWMTSC